MKEIIISNVLFRFIKFSANGFFQQKGTSTYYVINILRLSTLDKTKSEIITALHNECTRDVDNFSYDHKIILMKNV